MTEVQPNSSGNPYEQFTREVLRSYDSKTLTDQELIARIDRERQVAGSWVQRTVDDIYAKLADPLNVDFGKLASTDEAADETTHGPVPTSGGPSSQTDEGGVGETVRP